MVCFVCICLLFILYVISSISVTIVPSGDRKLATVALGPKSIAPSIFAPREINLGTRDAASFTSKHNAGENPKESSASSNVC